MTQLKHLIRCKLNAVLDEILGSDEPTFGGDQFDFLERRFFEIQRDVEEFSEPDITVPAKELIETICDCVRILADFDEG